MSAPARLQQAPADAARARSRGLEQVNLGGGDGTVAYRVEFEYPGKGASVLEDLGVYSTPDLAAVAHDVVACKVAFDAANGDSGSLEGVASDLNFPLNCYNFQRQFWTSLRKSSLPQVILDIKSRGLAEQLYHGPTWDKGGGAQPHQQQPQQGGAGGGTGGGRQPPPPPGRPPQQQQVQRGGGQQSQQPQQRPGGGQQPTQQRPGGGQQPTQRATKQQQQGQDGERQGPAPPAKRQKTGQPDTHARHSAPPPAGAASAADKQAAGGSRQQRQQQQQQQQEQQQERSPERRQASLKAEPAVGKAGPAGVSPPSPPAARPVAPKPEAAAGSSKKPSPAGSPKKPLSKAASVGKGGEPSSSAAAAAAAAAAAPPSPQQPKPPAFPAGGRGKEEAAEAEAGAGAGAEAAPPASPEPFNIWLKDVEWPPGSSKYPLYVKNTQLSAKWFTLTASAVEGFAKEAEDGEFILEEQSTHATHKSRFWIKQPKDGGAPTAKGTQ